MFACLSKRRTVKIVDTRRSVLPRDPPEKAGTYIAYSKDIN
jgi:hypothetical protein